MTSYRLYPMHLRLVVDNTRPIEHVQVNALLVNALYQPVSQWSLTGHLTDRVLPPKEASK